MARTVPLKLNYAAREGLLKGPQYTIREDPPWLLERSTSATSARRASSVYSGEESHHVQINMDHHDPQPPPPRMTLHPNHSSTFPSSRQEVMDYGTQTRPSRMPIFKQVRSMLSNNRSAASPATSPTAIKWDELSGEPSDNGKESRIKPSTYKSPYDGAFQARRRSPEQRVARTNKPRTGRHSPVSVLVDEELRMLERDQANSSPPTSRPVSPVTPVDHTYPPFHLNPNTVAARPKTEGSAFRRKPVVAPSPVQAENLPPSLDFHSHASGGFLGDTLNLDEPESRFSWTTAGQSEGPRKSTDTRFSRQNRSAHGYDSQAQKSHFSWSTIATNMTMHQRDQTPPPSPPPVPPQFLEPPSYGTPPTQSILSRQRPFKRVEATEWAPERTPNSSSSYTPRSMSPRVRRIDDPVTTTPTAEGKKALPLPPLHDEKSLSHLEALLTQEKNIIMQRRNIEKSITDLEKIEKASPLDVSFKELREAKKKLGERRGVLDEIRKEEMEMGIRIARARRKEDFGDGEGTLWVRRVTG